MIVVGALPVAVVTVPPVAVMEPSSIYLTIIIPSPPSPPPAQEPAQPPPPPEPVPSTASPI